MFQPLKTRNLGYWLILLMLVVAGVLNLGTPLLTVLFSYFVLRKLRFTQSKWIPATIFILLVLGFLYLIGYFGKQAVVALPRIAEDSIPKMIRFAEEKKLPLPFEDVNEFKGDEGKPEENRSDEDRGKELRTRGINWLTTSLRTELRSVANFARIASKEFAFLFIGFVVAISLFFNPALDLKRGAYPVRNNLYSFACDEVLKRFRSFYESFARVMGAQLIISMINTGFTAVYVLIVGLPYAALVIVLTFFCGMLPIIGNLVSNSVIVALSIMISPKMAIASLIFLIVLHKTEYFLNSKIIGERINNPVWLTLLGLLLGERLMGIPGMVLAPVVLDFIKNEASTIPIPSYAPKRLDPDAEIPEEIQSR
jgi:predicted PurR-regulated permease PerM